MRVCACVKELGKAETGIRDIEKSVTGSGQAFRDVEMVATGSGRTFRDVETVATGSG